MARKPQSEFVARPIARKRAGGKARSAPAKAPNARKLTPLKDLSPDYAARLRKAAKRQGITVRELRKRGVGAARGHATPIGTTESQLKRLKREAKIEAFARQQTSLIQGTDDADVAAVVAGLKRHIAREGMGFLTRLQAEIDRMRARWLAGERDTRGRPVPLGYSLEALGEEWDLPPETFGYH